MAVQQSNLCLNTGSCCCKTSLPGRGWVLLNNVFCILWFSVQGCILWCALGSVNMALKKLRSPACCRRRLQYIFAYSQNPERTIKCLPVWDFRHRLQYVHLPFLYHQTSQIRNCKKYQLPTTAYQSNLSSGGRLRGRMHALPILCPLSSGSSLLQIFLLLALTNQEIPGPQDKRLTGNG